MQKTLAVPRTSDGAAHRVLLRQSSCMTATPVVEIMHTQGPGRITYVCLRIRNGLQTQRHRTRVTCTVQSIRHTEPSWMTSRTTRCLAPFARQTVLTSSWYPRARNATRVGLGSTMGFWWRKEKHMCQVRSMCVWTANRSLFRALTPILTARCFIFKKQCADRCRACPILVSENWHALFARQSHRLFTDPLYYTVYYYCFKTLISDVYPKYRS